MNTNTIEQDKNTRDFIEVLSYIMAVLGLMNIALIFAPYLISSYGFKIFDATFSITNPSLFKIIYNGITDNSAYAPYFAALAVIMVIASILYVIHFAAALMKKENILKYSVIASAVFLAVALALYALNVYSLAKYRIITFDFSGFLYFELSNLVPKAVITSAVANIVSSAIIRYEIKKSLA